MTNTWPDEEVAVECRIRRTGSPAHEVGSGDHTGFNGDAMFKSSAESAALVTTVGEFGSGSPPKSNRLDGLAGESVCQARDGPCGLDEVVELLTSVQGVDSVEKVFVSGR